MWDLWCREYLWGWFYLQGHWFSFVIHRFNTAPVLIRKWMVSFDAAVSGLFFWSSSSFNITQRCRGRFWSSGKKAIFLRVVPHVSKVRVVFILKLLFSFPTWPISAGPSVYWFFIRLFKSLLSLWSFVLLPTVRLPRHAALDETLAKRRAERWASANRSSR